MNICKLQFVEKILHELNGGEFSTKKLLNKHIKYLLSWNVGSLSLDENYSGFTMFNNWLFFNEKVFEGDVETKKAKITRMFLHEAFGHGFIFFFFKCK